MEFAEPVTVDRVAVTSAGEIAFEFADGRSAKPVRTYIETTYERPKKPKVLNRLPGPTHRLSIAPWPGLTRYKMLFAIDTNETVHQGERIGLTGVVRVLPIPTQRLALVSSVLAIELRNLTTQFRERAGWLRAIDTLVSAAGIQFLHERIGLIVDSDLDSLPRFNSRALPLVGDRFLPMNMEFVFATSDAGKENILNVAIARADAIGRQLLGHIPTADPQTDPLRDATPDAGY